MEVRQFICFTLMIPQMPLLEKAKANSQAAIALGHLEALGNDLADYSMAAGPPWSSDVAQFKDPVALVHSTVWALMTCVPPFAVGPASQLYPPPDLS